MTPRETELRETLAPLRDEHATDAEIAAVLAATTARPVPTRRRSPRVIAGLAAATAIVGIALAALPAATPERSDDRLSADSILQAAAAVAAEQPPTAFTGYRYTQWLEHWRWQFGDTGPAPVVEIEQTVETWVDRTWSGRFSAEPPRVIEGGEFAKRLAREPEGPYRYGDDSRPDLTALPTEPDALREALRADILDGNWAPGLPTTDELHYYLLREVVWLLGAPTTTPALRAAAFELLARMPGVEPAHGATDGLGRTGQAVRVPTRRAHGAITIIFDPATSQMLYWAELGSGGGTPDQEHTIVRAAQVEAVGDRP
jgi:hypothetical protein